MSRCGQPGGSRQGAADMRKVPNVLYTAILIACLSGTPGDCRTHEMLITAGANPISAYVEAQTRAAEWLQQHPGLAQHSLTIRPGRSA